MPGLRTGNVNVYIRCECVSSGPEGKDRFESILQGVDRIIVGRTHYSTLGGCCGVLTRRSRPLESLILLC